MCLRVTGNPADAMDATQETFLRVFAHLGSFEGRARLSTWIHSIAHNTSRELRRQRARRPWVSLDGMQGLGGEAVWSVDVRDEPPERSCSRREVARGVRVALRRLPRGLREVVRLRYLEGSSYADLALRLGIPVGTVKSRLSRAHAALEPILVALAREAGLVGEARVIRGPRAVG